MVDAFRHRRNGRAQGAVRQAQHGKNRAGDLSEALGSASSRAARQRERPPAVGASVYDIPEARHAGRFAVEAGAAFLQWLSWRPPIDGVTAVTYVIAAHHREESTQ